MESLYGYLYYRLDQSHPDAEDTFQDTMLAAVESIQQYDPRKGSLIQWVYGIARQKLALFWRRTGLHAKREHKLDVVEKALESGKLPEQIILDQELSSFCALALATLPERYQKVLRLKYFKGLGIQTISDRMGISSPAVMSLLTRSREAFKKIFIQYIKDEPIS
jgi:RNA polymerase sigma-70 factor (ECF subfamily)